MHDYIFSIGNAIMAGALLPSLMSQDKPALKTSLLTGIILGIFSATFFSLGLYLSCAMLAVSSVLWLTLAYQKVKSHK